MPGTGTRAALDRLQNFSMEDRVLKPRYACFL